MVKINEVTDKEQGLINQINNTIHGYRVGWEDKVYKSAKANNNYTIILDKLNDLYGLDWDAWEELKYSEFLKSRQFKLLTARLIKEFNLKPHKAQKMIRNNVNQFYFHRNDN